MVVAIQVRSSYIDTHALLLLLFLPYLARNSPSAENSFFKNGARQEKTQGDQIYSFLYQNCPTECTGKCHYVPTLLIGPEQKVTKFAIPYLRDKRGKIIIESSSDKKQRILSKKSAAPD